MTAALGRFAFRVIVAGSITPFRTSGTQQYRIMITDVGIYLRDSFDFNGDQFLGFWDDSDNSVSIVNPLSGTAVSNKDFRDWRKNHGKGGDFLVFSDIQWLSRTPPDTFIL